VLTFTSIIIFQTLDGFSDAFTFFAAMTASNEALSYVSYPTAVLAKSSKLIPTMLVGFLLERKRFSTQEWCGAALITAGITTFNLSRLSTNDAANEQDVDSIFGIGLLLFSLVMDGLLASFQGALKKETKGKYRIPSALECMLWINAYAIIFMLPLSIWTGQFANGITLFQKSKMIPAETLLRKAARKILRRKRMPNASLSLAWTILWLNLTAAAGQIFIFFTIQLFSPLMCTTITTTRKFLTILLSVWNFGHRFTKVQWSAIIMVFGGLYLAIVSKFSTTGSVKGREDSKPSKKD
jgi:UDP-galactose transporter B1